MWERQELKEKMTSNCSSLLTSQRFKHIINTEVVKYYTWILKSGAFAYKLYTWWHHWVPAHGHVWHQELLTHLTRWAGGTHYVAVHQSSSNWNSSFLFSVPLKVGEKSVIGPKSIKMSQMTDLGLGTWSKSWHPNSWTAQGIVSLTSSTCLSPRDVGMLSLYSGVKKRRQ